jgi:hypothetical protein
VPKREEKDRHTAAYRGMTRSPGYYTWGPSTNSVQGPGPGGGGAARQTGSDTGGVRELAEGYKGPRADKAQGVRQRAGQGQEAPRPRQQQAGSAVPVRANRQSAEARVWVGMHRGEDGRSGGPR